MKTFQQDIINKVLDLNNQDLGRVAISKLINIPENDVRLILKQLDINVSHRIGTKSETVEKFCTKCNDLKLVEQFRLNGKWRKGICIECERKHKSSKRKEIVDLEFKSIDNSIIEQIRILAAKERSHKKIAKAFNFSIKKIVRIMKEHDIQIAKAPAKNLIKLSNDELNNIKKLYDLGFGSNVISRELKLKLSYVIRGFEILDLARGQHSPNVRSIPKERTCTKCKLLKEIGGFTIFTNKSGNLTYKLVCISCDDKKKERNKKIRRKKNAERMKNDPMYAIRDTLSSQIRSMLKHRGSSKKGQSCLNYLNFTLEELVKHIEYHFTLPGNGWMNWNNRGMYIKDKWKDGDKSTWRWQLDHIIPHSHFEYTSMEDQAFKDCWALNNLRPYSAKQNQLDGITGVRHTKNHPNIKKNI